MRPSCAAWVTQPWYHVPSGTSMKEVGSATSHAAVRVRSEVTGVENTYSEPPRNQPRKA